MAADASPPTNGSGAAALMASAIGAFALGVLSLAGDAFVRVASVLTLWSPTGPLSGVTTVAIAVWLLAWTLLSRRWARREVDLTRISKLAVTLFVAGLLLTFPPVMDLFQGK